MLTPERTMSRILVVDDEPHIRQILKFTLEKAAYQVFCAADGEEALEKMAEVKPSLILLDVMMPKMDGFEVCRKMRQDFALSQIPVIMLTAKGQEEDIVRGLNLGADDYVTKPFSIKELLARSRAFLRRQESAPDVYRFGRLRLDLVSHPLFENAAEVHLTPKAFRMP